MQNNASDYLLFKIQKRNYQRILTFSYILHSKYWIKKQIPNKPEIHNIDFHIKSCINYHTNTSILTSATAATATGTVI